MSITMLCHVDNVSYKEKPKNQVGAVQNRFKMSDFMSIDIGEVIKALENGQTIALANCEDRKKDKFKAANSAALDFDNGHSSEFEKSDPAGRAAIVKAAITGGTISKQEVIDRCREKGFAAPTFIYSTFSTGQYIQDCLALAEQGLITAEELDRIQATSTFRAVWVFDHTVNDPAIYTDVCERLRKIFPESDPAFKIEGVLFGTKYSDTQRTDEIVDITTIPYLPTEQESSDPEQITVDTITASTDPPPQQGFRVDLSAADARSYSAMSQSDSQRRNIEVYLQFLSPSMLSDAEWINVANAMKTEGFSYSEFDRWSNSGDPRYDEASNRRRWDSLEIGMNTGGTIAYYAKTYGHMTAEALKAALYPQGMKPKHTTAPAGAAADQSEIYNWTSEQWREYATKCYNAECLCVDTFKHLYLVCMSNGLLEDGKLPKFFKPKKGTMNLPTKIGDNGQILETTKVDGIIGFTFNIPLFSQALREANHIVNISTNANTTGAVYVYDPRGKYDKVSIEEERGIIHKYLEIFDKEGNMWNTKTIKDVSFLLHSPHETKLLDDFNANEDIINFRNGVYNIQTNVLLPHTHEFLSTVQLPLDYDPAAADRATPAFDSMLDHLSGGRDDVKQLILQFSAAIISNIDIGKLKAFLMIYGARDSGKSQLFYLLSQLLGKNNFCVTSMNLLAENRFEPYNLYGMRLAGRPELEIGEVVKHHSKIKELTGGDPTRAEIKNGGTFTFRYKGGLLFTSNERPQLENADEAFYSRLRLICVERSLSREERDPEFMKKLWDERQSIAMKLLPLIPHIKHNGTIIDPVSSVELKKEYRAENDPVIEFFINYCAMSDKKDDSTLFRHVYWAYEHWAERNRYNVVTSKKFSNTLDSYIKREGLTRGKFDKDGKPLGATVQGAQRKTYCTFEVLPSEWTFSANESKSE